MATKKGDHHAAEQNERARTKAWVLVKTPFLRRRSPKTNSTDRFMTAPSRCVPNAVIARARLPWGSVWPSIPLFVRARKETATNIASSGRLAVKIFCQPRNTPWKAAKATRMPPVIKSTSAWLRALLPNAGHIRTGTTHPNSADRPRRQGERILIRYETSVPKIIHPIYFFI